MLNKIKEWKPWLHCEGPVGAIISRHELKSLAEEDVKTSLKEEEKMDKFFSVSSNNNPL